MDCYFKLDTYKFTRVDYFICLPLLRSIKSLSVYVNNEEGKDQESIQSSTTPDPGHHKGSFDYKFEYLLFISSEGTSNLSQLSNVTKMMTSPT